MDRRWARIATIFHAVIDLPQRGQDQHRGHIGLGAQFADDRQPIALGQHAVDDKHLVVAVLGQGETIFTIGRVLGNVADFAEGFDQIVRGVAVVFDNEQAHASLKRCSL